MHTTTIKINNHIFIVHIMERAFIQIGGGGYVFFILKMNDADFIENNRRRFYRK